MLQLKEANGLIKEIDEGKKELEFLFADSSKSAELDKLREREESDLKLALILQKRDSCSLIIGLSV